jgi:DNA-cytosine methyltransferase
MECSCNNDWTAASLFSGIGGFELGLAQAGIRTTASVEIDPAARGVLKHRFPDVTLFPDVQEVTADDILSTGFCPYHGVLTAGFPCQDVSLAGKRRGLTDADGNHTRSGLFFEIIRILADLKPRWFLLENVPGLLTSNGGRDMGTVVGTLVELGYGVSWRVLDAQYFGVPQRRRRVFVVGCLDDPASAGEVLLEPEGFAGDLAAGREARPAAARAAADGAGGGERRRGLLAESGIVQGITASLGGAGADAQHAQAGWLIPEVHQQGVGPMEGEEVAGTLTTRYYKGVNSTVDDGANVVTYRKSRRAQSTEDYETWVPSDHSNTLNCFDSTSEVRSTHLVAFALQPTQDGPGANVIAREVTTCPTLTSTDLAKQTDRGLRVVSPTGEVSHTLTANGFDASEDGTGRGWPTINEGEWAVRRLTPLECERLQGFPDNHTAEREAWDKKKGEWKGAVVNQSDSARGHQLGNAVAVPNIAWIAKRMRAVDAAWA